MSFIDNIYEKSTPFERNLKQLDRSVYFCMLIFIRLTRKEIAAKIRCFSFYNVMEVGLSPKITKANLPIVGKPLELIAAKYSIKGRVP